MSVIPGLSFVPADDEAGEGIEIPSFEGIIKAPESHRKGNCRSIDEFEKIGIIYEGKFGAVYKSRDRKNGQIYALKKYIFTQEMLKNGIPANFLQEINILLLLKHHNIVNLHGTLAGKKLENSFLLLDYCITSLQQLMEKNVEGIYDRDVVKFMMLKLFDGISFLHESTVVHRNISCGNILFNECGTLKLSGFRTAKFHANLDMTPAVTELTYRAPELLFKAKSYGTTIDIWSAGCVFAHLLLKKPLFTGDSELDILKSIFSILGTPSEIIWPGFDILMNKGTVDEKIIFPENQPFSDMKTILAGVPDTSSQLLQDMIIYYPEARLKASDVLKSPYITNPPDECSPEKMVSILDRALSVHQLLQVPTEMES